MTDLRDCEQAVKAAAQEERAAHAALQESIKPGDPDWTETNEEAYQACLARWRAASRVLVDALNRVGNDGLALARQHSLSGGRQHNRH